MIFAVDVDRTNYLFLQLSTFVELEARRCSNIWQLNNAVGPSSPLLASLISVMLEMLNSLNDGLYCG